MTTRNDDQLILTPQQREQSPELQWVDHFTRLLDTKFCIPGTQMRFGVDFLLGLIPAAGDIASMVISGILIATMAKNGASGRVVLRMMFNVALDTVVGSIPILGNLFDLYFRANSRNMILMREYYEDNQHRRSVWPMVVAVLVGMLVLLVVSGVLIVLLMRYVWKIV